MSGRVYNLFLGVFPDEATARAVVELAEALRLKHGLPGRVRPQRHLHVSLYFLGQMEEVPPTLAEDAGRICGPVAAATGPFVINFNQVFSFHGRPGNHPCVLTGEERENEGIHRLHGALHAAFAGGFPSNHPGRKFIPHLTLLYDQKQLPPEPIGPVYWTVKEIMLVCSEVGATRYHWLGRWKLGG